MHCDQRGRTSGLDGDAGSAQIELVGNACRQKVLIVGYAGLIGTDFSDELGVDTEDIEKVLAQTGASKKADRAWIALRDIAGRLQRMPGRLEKEAVLGIENLGLSRTEAKE